MSEAAKRPRTRLYLITPPRIEDVHEFAALTETLLDAGDVACLQLRLKAGDKIDEAMTRKVAGAVLPMAQACGVAVLINDSAELAAGLGADGVHLGMGDGSIKAARKLLGGDMIIGASAKNSRHTAMLAGEQGADYVAFGAFYPTGTKSETVQADIELLAFWQEVMELPCVAIGGITPQNGEALVRAGADFLAVSSGVWDHPDGAVQAVREFNEMLDKVDAETGSL